MTLAIITRNGTGIEIFMWIGLKTKITKNIHVRENIKLVYPNNKKNKHPETAPK